MSIDYCLVVGPEKRPLTARELSCIFASLQARGYLDRCRVTICTWEEGTEESELGRGVVEPACVEAWIAASPGTRYISFDIVRAARIGPVPDKLYLLFELFQRSAWVEDLRRYRIEFGGFGLSQAGVHFWLTSRWSIDIVRLQELLRSNPEGQSFLELFTSCIEVPVQIVLPETPAHLFRSHDDVLREIKSDIEGSLHHCSFDDATREWIRPYIIEPRKASLKDTTGEIRELLVVTEEIPIGGNGVIGAYFPDGFCVSVQRFGHKGGYVIAAAGSFYSVIKLAVAERARQSR